MNTPNNGETTMTTNDEVQLTNDEVQLTATEATVETQEAPQKKTNTQIRVNPGQKLPKGFAYKELATEIVAIVERLPGVTTGKLAAVLEEEHKFIMFPQYALGREKSITQNVLNKLRRQNILVNANGWRRVETVDPQEVADHNEREAGHGLRRAINAIDGAEKHHAIAFVDAKIRCGTRAAEAVMNDPSIY